MSDTIKIEYLFKIPHNMYGTLVTIFQLNGIYYWYYSSEGRCYSLEETTLAGLDEVANHLAKYWEATLIGRIE